MDVVTNNTDITEYMQGMRIYILKIFLLWNVGCFAFDSPVSGQDIDNEHNMGILSIKAKGKAFLAKNNNIMTQAMFDSENGRPQENTKFVIQYDYTLSENISIPNNSILEFDGGSISGAYTITGRNTGIVAPLVKIFNTDVAMAGTWNVVELYPEWFGAISDINFDSSIPISNCIKTAYQIRSSVKFKRGNYKVSGNNPCGLEKVSNTEPPLIYSEERNLNIDFSNSHIYYYPSRETDCFAFVGYLRSSVWENLILHICQTDVSHKWGDVFSTNFGTSGALHRFSCNTFKNMWITSLPIKGVSTCFRRVLNFDCSGGEKTHHDDLSIFEKINASNFLRFYYTNNSNSVSISFNDCNLTMDRDNSILYDVDTYSWAGFNRFNNCHFTIMDCNRAMLVRLKSINQSYGTVYFDKSRVEIRPTATNWMYFDIENGKVFFNDFYSVNYAGIESSHSFGRMKYGTVNFAECLGVYTPMTLIGVPQGYDNLFESLIFNHCSFIADETHVVPYPKVIYESSNGVEYTNRYEAIKSKDTFGNVVVKDCSSRTPNVRDRWLIDYTLNNSRVLAIDESSFVVKLAHKDINKYLGTSTVAYFNAPCDIVINKASYTQFGYDLNNQGIQKVGLYIYRDGNIVETHITPQVPIVGKPLVLAEQLLYLKAGDQIRCALLKSDNTEIADNYSTLSYLEIEYKVANWIEDLRKIYSTANSLPMSN